MVEINKLETAENFPRFHFFTAKDIYCYMLKTERQTFYRVKKGQTLAQIADYFSVSQFLLAKRNRLTAPPYEGQILRIPQESGNAYLVQAGDTKALLCGSEEGYRERNGTDVFYIGMRVIIG